MSGPAVLVRSRESLAALEPKLGGDPSVLWLCGDWSAYRELRSKGRKAEPWDALLDPFSLDEREAWIRARSKAWYRGTEGDFTVVESHSLGWILDWFAWCLDLFPLYRFLFVLEKRLAEKPASLWLDDRWPPGYAEVARAAAERLSPGTKVEVYAGRAASGSLAWTLPRLGEDERRWTLWANRLARPFRRGRPVLAFSPYMTLEPLLDALIRAPTGLALAGSPPRRRWWPRLIAKGADVLAPEPPRPTSLLAPVRLAWYQRKASPNWRAAFDWKGLSVWPALEPILDRAFGPDLEAAWSAASQAEAWLARTGARALAVPFDGPASERALISAARKLGIPSAVVLHGLPAAFNAEDNFQADRFLLWGPGNLESYKAAGADAAKITLVGNSYFDAYAGEARPAPTKLKRVLLVTHSLFRVDLAATSLDPELFAVSVLEALKPLGLEITAKLHPSESLEHYREVLAPWAGAELDIARDVPIRRCLEEADLVIGCITTVLLEAALMGRPALCANFSAVKGRPPFDGRSGFRLVRSPEELKAEVERLMKGPSEIERLTSAYPALLDRFAGPRSGANAAAVAEELVRLALREKAA